MNGAASADRTIGLSGCVFLGRALAVLPVASQVVDVFMGWVWCPHRSESWGTELTEFEQSERCAAQPAAELVLGSGALVVCDSGWGAETVPVG
jgi:hypothetical protein